MNTTNEPAGIDLDNEHIEKIWNSLDGKQIIAGESQLNWNAALRREFAKAIARDVLARHAPAPVAVALDKDAEKQRFITWGQVFHRNARSYTARDFDHGLAAWLAAKADAVAQQSPAPVVAHDAPEAPASAQPDRGAAQAADVCAEMRALCPHCGGTGDVHRADGEWLGACDCPAPASGSGDAGGERAECTNSDSWNCKYCPKTDTCAALKDPRNFGTPASGLDTAVLDKLEALARAATPGPWEPGSATLTTHRGCEGSWWEMHSIMMAPEGKTAHWQAGFVRDESNAAFIAAANPATILALIAQARAYQPEGATGTTGATVIWPSEKFVHERIATLMADIGMPDDTPLWNALSRFEDDLRSRVEAMPAFPAAATSSIDTLEFQALAGTWCGASQSCDRWTRTIGAKQAWADLIGHIDARLAAPASAQPDRGAAQFCRHCGYDHSVGPLCITAAALSPASQPVAPETAPAMYQRRMRPMWRAEGEGWTSWEECTKDAYEDCLRVKELNDWQHDARALYTSAVVPSDAKDAAPTTVPDHSERGAANAGGLTGESLAKLLAGKHVNDYGYRMLLNGEEIGFSLQDLLDIVKTASGNQSRATVEDKTIAAGQEAANAKDAERLACETAWAAQSATINEKYKLPLTAPIPKPYREWFGEGWRAAMAAVGAAGQEGGNHG